MASPLNCVPEETLDLMDILLLLEEEGVEADGACIPGYLLEFPSSIFDAHLHSQHLIVRVFHLVDVIFAPAGLGAETFYLPHHFGTRFGQFLPLSQALDLLLPEVYIDQFRQEKPQFVIRILTGKTFLIEPQFHQHFIFIEVGLKLLVYKEDILEHLVPSVQFLQNIFLFL